MREGLLTEVEQKFRAIGQNHETHLEGLLWSAPLTYWDYIQTDALLHLQVRRSTLPDEMVFILYHQINELLFKMILWEIAQVSEANRLDPSFFAEKLARISRYFDMLAGSFDIMSEGMEPGQYLKFRNTLTPASGFQSAQYRLIEFSSTELINLIDVRYRSTIDRNTSYEYAFEHLYWQAAGKDPKTGEKNTLLQLFEKRYKPEFLRYMEDVNEKNLLTRYKQLPRADRENPVLVEAMRHYDRTVNITWVMAHYRAAQKYLEAGTQSAEATGGSNWKKYMHPRSQRRIFFPELWTPEELEGWGSE